MARKVLAFIILLGIATLNCNISNIGEGEHTSYTNLAWEPNGNRLAITATNGMLLYDDNNLTTTIDATFANSIAWHPNRNMLAFVNDGRNIILFYPDNKQAHLLPITNDIRALAWHPGGQMLATSHNDHTLQIWTVSIDKDAVSSVHPVTRLQGHTGWITALEWSPDGKILATSSTDRTIRLWNISSGTTLQILQYPQNTQHNNTSILLTWSPDNHMIATLDVDNETIHVWDVQTGQIITTFSGRSDIAWHPYNNQIATATQEGAISRDGTTGQTAIVFKPIQGSAEKLSWSPDGTSLAAIGISPEGPNLWLWDALTGDLVSSSSR